MRTYLDQLHPGDRFRLAGMPEVTGELVRLTECSATVRVDGATQTWAPATVVEPLTNEEIEDMTAKTKKAPAKKTAKPAAKKDARAKKVDAMHAQAAKPAKPKATNEKKVSALDAAAQVLAHAKEPMGTQHMIEQMGAKGLWSSPNGKTPHATLYAAILREIATKGKDARFKKVDRGLFAARV